MINPNTIGGLADRVGVSFAISVALLLIIATFMRWFMRSVFDKLVNSHIIMIEYQKVANERNTESLQKLVEIETIRFENDRQIKKDLIKSNQVTGEKLDRLLGAIFDQTDRLEKPLTEKLDSIISNRTSE